MFPGGLPARAGGESSRAVTPSFGGQGTLRKEYAAGAGEATRIQVKPSRKLKNRKTGKIKKKKFTSMVSARSGLDGTVKDTVKILVKTK